MCGIVGLFLKDPKLEPQLGAMLTDMLITMTDRGPDSAGIAIYGRPEKGKAKLTVQSATPDADFETLAADLGKAIAAKVTGTAKDTHMVLELPDDRLDAARHALRSLRPNAKVMSAGEGIEIYKEVGLPKDVAARFDVASAAGELVAMTSARPCTRPAMQIWFIILASCPAPLSPNRRHIRA